MLLIAVLSAVAVYLIVTRGLPQLLSWLCYRKLHVHVKIGHIGILSLSLGDVIIRKRGMRVAIDSIGISSSFVNRSHNKLLVIYIRDVRIQKDEADGSDEKPSSPVQVSTSPSTSKYIMSNTLINLSQILSLHVCNVDIVLLDTVMECLIHCSAREFKLEGSSDCRLSQLMLNLKTVTCKLLQPVQPLHHVNTSEQAPCLAELSLDLDLVLTFDPKNELQLKVASLLLTPEITLTEGMFPLKHSNLQAIDAINAFPEEKTKMEIDSWSNEAVEKFEKIFPEEIRIEMTRVKVKVIPTQTPKILSCDLKNFSINIAFKQSLYDAMMADVVWLKLVHVGVMVVTDELVVTSSSVRLVTLNRILTNIKLEEGSLVGDITVSSFRLGLSEEDILFWWNASPLRISSKTQTTSSPKLPKFIKHLKTLSSLQMSLEFWDVEVMGHLAECPSFRTSCTHTKIIVDLPLCQEQGCQSLLGVCQHLNSAEILVETVWCKLDDEGLPDNLCKKHHYWNTVFFMGMFLLTVKRPAVFFKWEGMIDNMQLEWSPVLLDLSRALARYIPQNKENKRGIKDVQVVKDSSEPSSCDTIQSIPSTNINIHLKWTNVNVFLLTNKKVGILVRVDVFSAKRQDEKIIFCSEGIKILLLSVMNLYHPCLKSSELKHSNIYLENVIVTYKITKNDISLQFLENVTGKWTTKLHLTVFEIVQDFLEFKNMISGISSGKKELTASSSFSNSVLSLKVRGPMHLQAVLSQRHTFSVGTSSVTFKLSEDSIVLQSSMLTLMFDSHDILVVNGIHVARTPHNDQLSIDRETYTDLILKENKACIVVCEEVKLKFPHQYSLAEAFSEEMINIVKWLKIVNKTKKTEFTADLPLPADLLIKLKKFSVEFCDDPFEVKLRDNFELLEDEYKENQKRWKMLDAKIEEFRRTNLLLPTGKVEEIYANLQMKNTDVYIQRSRQMYSTTPMRTCLGFWQFTGVEILSLADLSYHGKENVIKQMKDIDAESPFPEEGLQFSTLWCRMIRGSCNSCTFTLRDFPSPVLDIQRFHVWGRLIGAEQEANKRAKRTSVVEVESPWTNMNVERSLPPLKFYHDFSCEIDHFTIGYGPCWEPAFAQLNLSMENVNKPSSDPSLPLPFWDKMRLLFHGRLTMFIQHATMILHASLDPYNTTEEMDFSWTGLLFDWTDGQIVLKGDIDVYVRTASKYDDCHFLHLPNLKLSFKLDWLCLADPNDHHSVMPCAPDKLPEYSSNQEHDSYRAFRSVNLNMSISMETRSISNSNTNNIPSLLFYSSTLRWLENLKNNLSSVARPIKRGRFFNNCRPRKPQLGRHYKSLHLSLSLHQFDVCYWMSFAKLRGFHLKAGKLTMSSGHNLLLVPSDDGLIHRVQAEWNIAYMNCELNDAEIWLQSAAADDTLDEMNMSFRTPVEKCYFLSLKRVSYVRETALPDTHSGNSADDTPTHKLVLHDLKGAWTKNNKDIVFSMFDSYVNIKLLRRNLSTEALKGFKVDNQVTSISKSRGNSVSLGVSGTASPLSSAAASSSTSTTTVRQQSSPIIAMLQQLVSEADKATVYTEDLAGSTREQQLHGVAACQTEDVLHNNWRIELINSQVLLKGCETSGYVFMSAAKSQILQRIHQPVWQDCRLVTKTTWKGSLECMQYYATVDPGEMSTSMDNIMWLTVDNIEERESMVIADLPDLVGSGQGVGGVVSGTVGGADPRNPVQLQRIVSRCSCQFFYASYGENVDPKNLETVPPLPLEDDTELWTKEVPVDSFTLMHHDLNICTNSLQYGMILDILNNLLLFVEPKKKEYNEKLQRMRFQLQLSHIADQRTPILLLQNQVRSLLSNLRRLEREIYILQKAMDEDDPDESMMERMDDLERQIYECKVQLNAQSEELAMMIWCFKEQQLAAIRKLRIGKDSQVMPSRWNEVCFKHAQWRLTEVDGQLGIADVVLSNFLYGKQTKNDDSVEHLLELGDVRVTNLLPNQMYKVVFQPTNLQGNIPFDRQCAVRIFCREKPPVGGISIKDHFEVNVVPLTLGLTTLFYKTMLRFCFPGKETETVDKQSPDELEVDNKSRKKHGPVKRAISFDDQDDIEKMKERAEKNKMFLYIKIPEVPVKLSFKAEKEKNIKDVHDFTLVVPTLEYHNVTWTWLDFLLAMKNDSKKALLSQAIKQKLQIKSGKTSTEESTVTQEEDKVRLLLGAKLHGPSEKEKKRTLFSRSNK